MGVVVNGYTIEPGANLVGAHLTRANLQGADLTGAKLINVLIDETTVITRYIILNAGDWGGGTTFFKNIKKWFAKCNSHNHVKYV